jgi:hypothetical protein
MRDDRPCRGDRKLLACNLENERAEGVERREFVHPRPRAEVRARLYQASEDRVCIAKELACVGIGDWSPLSG